LSVTVLGREFQVAGAEQPTAECTLGKCCTGERFGQSSGRVGLHMLWRLRYAGVDVVRTLYISIANLYVIRCWTGSQCS